MGKTPLEQPAFVAAFSLSITQALGEQLMVALKKLEVVPLTVENIDLIDRRGGIYQLFLDGESVYVGKSTKALSSRIGIHLRKLSGRTPGLLERMSFRALYVNEDLDALAPEKMLIRTLKQTADAPWNQNGFGNKDPGRNRDKSLVKIGHFDREYSINLQLDVTLTTKKPVTNLFEAMTVLKGELSYNLRFPDPKNPAHRELKAINVDDDEVSDQTKTAWEWLEWIAVRLPGGWMITALPGYIITYNETNPGEYKSRLHTWLPDGSGNFDHQEHEPEWDEKGKIKADDEPDNDDIEDEN